MDFFIDKNSGVPYYRQIKNKILAEIASGRLGPGDMLPAEVSLSKQLEISTLVVHRAFRELMLEGLLVRKRGLGTFVAVPNQRTIQINGVLYGTTEELAHEGLALSTRIVTQEIIPASSEACAQLRLPGGTKVVHLLRVDLIRQYPYAIEDLYYVYDLFPDLATLDLNNRSTYAVIRERYRANPHHAVDEITAAAATTQEAALLGMRAGQPVMRKQRTAYLEDETPFLFARGAFHPDHFKLVVRESRTDSTIS